MHVRTWKLHETGNQPLPLAKLNPSFYIACNGLRWSETRSEAVCVGRIQDDVPDTIDNRFPNKIAIVAMPCLFDSILVREWR